MASQARHEMDVLILLFAAANCGHERHEMNGRPDEVNREPREPRETNSNTLKIPTGFARRWCVSTYGGKSSHKNKFLRPWEWQKVAAGRMRVVGKTSTTRWRKFYLAAARFGRRFQKKPILSPPTMAGQKASGHARPGRGRIGQSCRNWGGRSPDWPGRNPCGGGTQHFLMSSRKVARNLFIALNKST